MSQGFPELLSMSEVAARLRLSLPYVKKLTLQGQLPCLKAGRRVLYLARHLQQYLENLEKRQEQAQQPERPGCDSCYRDTEVLASYYIATHVPTEENTVLLCRKCLPAESVAYWSCLMCGFELLNSYPLDQAPSRCGFCEASNPSPENEQSYLDWLREQDVDPAIPILSFDQLPPTSEP